MPLLPEPVQHLSACLAQLPGIGPRSADRLALHIVQTDPAHVRQLAAALTAVREKVSFCRDCGGFTESQPCPLCQDPRRDASCVCVVERPTDLITLEKSGAFRGRYHVLGGKLSPLNGVEPEDLRIAALEHRVDRDAVSEIILALGSDVEGDATANYLARRLSSKPLKVTRLAQGLPVGSGLDYTDEVTLERALAGRRPI
ncbi:MAG: recombination protein RecR [Verrucomicrobia bacterium]|nr:recombination protein RecR [Verrucomicrobiota bacterium]